MNQFARRSLRLLIAAVVCASLGACHFHRHCWDGPRCHPIRHCR